MNIFYPVNGVKTLFMQQKQTLSDVLIPDNTNALLINPVEFNSLTIGRNSMLIII